MYRYRDNRRGVIWTREHNDLLRRWVAEGCTVKEIHHRAEAEFDATFTSPQIRSHLKYLGLTATRERAEKQELFTPEMKEWIVFRREMPPKILTRLFRAHFGEAVYSIPPRYVNAIAERARAEALRSRTDEEIFAEWEKVRKHISPRGQIAAEHWLWRYLPLDEKRTGSGVVFREG